MAQPANLMEMPLHVNLVDSQWNRDNQPANPMEMASACLGNWLSLPRPPPPSLPAFHCHLKGSNYTLCTVQYNAHYPNRLHWLNCSAVQSKAATSRHFANKERKQITSYGNKREC